MSTVGTLVTYRIEESIAVVTMDDGKRNALSPGMLAELNAAFDRAEADGVPVLLTGRPDTFSAGFDLRVLTSGSAGFTMVLTGFELGARILAFPHPVAVACNGHALAMGAFLLLAADYRIGTAGPYRIQANEVAMGITMPHFAVEICRQRLTPACFNRAVLNSEIFAPADAVPAGFLDRLVPAAELAATAAQVAGDLAKLDRHAFTTTKLRARKTTLEIVRAAIDADAAVFRALSS